MRGHQKEQKNRLTAWEESMLLGSLSVAAA
jgi:hypothetical protein